MSDAKPLTNQSNQEAQRDLIEQAQTVNEIAAALAAYGAVAPYVEAGLLAAVYPQIQYATGGNG